MDFEEIRLIISQAIEQTKSHQVDLVMQWLDGLSTKYRESRSPTTNLKLNTGQRFHCPCGRSFSTEITIRETTNVDTTSPPATPMLLMKNDFKNPQNSSESISKRSRILMIDPPVAPPPTQTPSSTQTTINLNGTNNSLALASSWPSGALKSYERSPELTAIESNRAESDTELSSDESRCLEDIDNVLSPDKTAMNNFMYSNDMWQSANTNNINDEDHHQHQHHHHHHHHHQHQHQHHEQQQMITLKPVSQEPVSPLPALVHDMDGGKPVATIHRRPMLIAYNESDACSPSRPSHFRCTQCNETFDSILLGQEHANSGLCTSDATVHTLENSDSQPSPSSSALFENFQEDMDESIPTRVDTKAACPVCNKVFSSVHTMIRHKTSIHDRHVRYACNICGRYFFRKDKLTSHMVYHQDFNTYVCCYCSLGFKSRMLMRQHLKRDHIFPGENIPLNEILSQCQVKKSLNLETNTSMAYSTTASSTTDRSSTISPAKRSLTHHLTAEIEMKQTNTLTKN